MENKHMVWSKRKGFLLTVLVLTVAVTGLAWSQQSASLPSHNNSDGTIYVTVREDGKPVQKCRLLYSWNLENGQKAYQVQAVDTGELITLTGLVDVPNAPQVVTEQPNMVSKVFRWGKSKTCPPGFPQPPGGMTGPGTTSPDVIVSNVNSNCNECPPPKTPVLAGFPK